MVYSVLIADDHDLFATGIQALLQNEPDFKVVGKVKSGVDVLAFLDNTPVDLVLLDLYMPNMDGFTCSRKLKKKFPKTRVIAVTMINSGDVYERCKSSLMDGFVLKSNSGTDLVGCMHSVLLGSPDQANELNEVVAENGKSDQLGLTKRELEIVKLIGQSHTNNEIAEIINRSVETVKKHRRNIYEKLDLNCKEDLIRVAMNHHLL